MHVCLILMCTRVDTCINKHFSFKIFLLTPPPLKNFWIRACSSYYCEIAMPINFIERSATRSSCQHVKNLQDVSELCRKGPRSLIDCFLLCNLIIILCKYKGKGFDVDLCLIPLDMFLIKQKTIKEFRF